MKKTLSVVTLLVAIATLAREGSAQSATFISPPVSEIISRAESVGEYEAIGVESAWNDGLIVTTVTLSLRQCLRGVCGNDVRTLQLYGGEADGIVQVVSGSPAPQLGFVFILATMSTNDDRHLRSGEHLFPIIEKSDGSLDLGPPCLLSRNFR